MSHPASIGRAQAGAGRVWGTAGVRRSKRRSASARAPRSLRESASTAVAAVALLLLALLGYQDLTLAKRLADSEARAGDIAARIIDGRLATMSAVRRESARSDAEMLLQSTLARIAALEHRASAVTRIVGSALPSVMFVQCAIRFEDDATGRPLRYVVGPGGAPLLTPGGPAMSIEGNGPVVERHITGTAFVATEARLIITNRHIVRPWEDDDAADVLMSRGFTPIMHRLVGYLPGKTEPVELELMALSDDADVAVLKSAGLPPDLPHLELNPAAPEPGETVVVMGYPTGMQALLARADDRFVHELREAQDIDFWRVAKELSISRLINPLASQGIVDRSPTPSSSTTPRRRRAAAEDRCWDSTAAWWPSTRRSFPVSTARTSASRWTGRCAC